MKPFITGLMVGTMALAAMPSAFAADALTLQLKWVTQAQFAGYLVAESKGFYDEEDIDLVWAEIAVAAVAGSAFYGVIALIERAVTFWHPSVRGGRA